MTNEINENIELKVATLAEQRVTIANRIEEVTTEIEQLENEVNEKSEAMIFGNAKPSEVTAIKVSLDEKKTELNGLQLAANTVEQIIEREGQSKFIPFARKVRSAKIAKIQVEYDKQAEAVIEARNKFAAELEKLGEVQRKANVVHYEYGDTLRSLGIEAKYTDTEVANGRVLFASTHTREEDALGIRTERQTTILDGKGNPFKGGN